MAYGFSQVPQPGNGFQQVHPENAGFSQPNDHQNPMAQAYARMALKRNGIQVPRGADAAALWRQFSQNRAVQNWGASQQAQQDPGAPDPWQHQGQDASMQSPQAPQGPPGGGQGQYIPGTPQTYGQPEELQGPFPHSGGLDRFVGRLPDGGYRGHALMQGLASSQDWRARIQQMAAGLSPANTIHRVANDPSQFGVHNPSGAAESALAIRKIAHVGEAHQAARKLASLLGHRRPSNSFRQTHDPNAY